MDVERKGPMSTARGVLRIAVGIVALTLMAPASGRCAGSAITLYGGLFGNKEYVQGWEGVQGSFGVHDYVSLLARVTGVHIIDSDRYHEGQLRRDDDFVRNPNHDDVKFQVGPVLGVYKRSWDAGLRLGVGGGDYGVYGTMSLWKTFAL